MNAEEQQAIEAALISLQEADRQHHFHSFTAPKAFESAPPFMIEEAKGCYIVGQGMRFFDAMAGLGCVNIGYSRADMAEVARAAVEKLSYYHSFAGVSNPSAARLAQKLVSHLPKGFQRVFFANSGSEANETLLKLVALYWQSRSKPEKKYIIARDGAYHGSSVMTTALNGRPEMWEGLTLDQRHIRHVEAPFWYRNAGDLSPDDYGVKAADAVEKMILELGPDKVAAVFVEPVQGTGGIIIPPASYFPRLNQIVKAHDVLLVADEVLTGLGRAGAWTASEILGVDADMMSVSKGLASGYAPIAAALLHERVYAPLAQYLPALHHGYTTSAHPLAAELALKNLEILEEEKLVEAAGGAMGRFFKERMQSLGAHPLVGEVRVMGFMAGLEIVRDKKTREQFPLDLAIDGHVAQAALLKGLIVRSVGNIIVLCPPLVMNRGEIEFVTKTLHDALDAVHQKLKDAGRMPV